MDQYFGLGMFTTAVVASAFVRQYRNYRPILAVKRVKHEATNIPLVNVEDVIRNMELIVQRDEGKRGIKEIIPDGTELLNAARDMVKSNYVAIITGFPCLLDYTPPTETDGPLGALAIAKALLVMGKKVIVLTDECNEEVLLACGAASSLSQYGDRFAMESFPPLEKFEPKDEQRLDEIGNTIDLVVAIERAGPNANGKYCTMRCRDMTNIVAPLDLLLQPSIEALNSDKPILKTKVNSIGIGDGGNEVGMGKIYNTIVNSSINHAKEIACSVPANHLIVCSVSNWGGYALAAASGALYASVRNGNNNQLPVEAVKSYVNALLPTDEEEMNKCVRIVNAGARDGLTAKQELMVDGMPFSKSLEVLNELRHAV